MSAWGKTGRVTVTASESGRFNNVLLDGRHIGIADASDGAWYAGVTGGSQWPDAPSRDAAILWVLRRVNPALWRQERGEVWRVRTYKYARGWHAIDPEGGQCQGCLRDFPSTIARAHDLATRRAATR